MQSLSLGSLAWFFPLVTHIIIITRVWSLSISLQHSARTLLMPANQSIFIPASTKYFNKADVTLLLFTINHNIEVAK